MGIFTSFSDGFFFQEHIQCLVVFSQNIMGMSSSLAMTHVETHMKLVFLIEK